MDEDPPTGKTYLQQAREHVEALDSQIQRVDERMASEAFEDSFKGVFQQQTFPADAIEEVRSFLTDLRTQL